MSKFYDFIKSFSNGDNIVSMKGSKPSFIQSILNKYLGTGLTGAETEANAFNAAEAEKQRSWETEMSNTAFQRQVADMQAAGINPALMYGGAGSSGASTPSGSVASSVSPSSVSMSDLMQLLTIKPQIEALKAAAKRDRDTGEAALITARANERNAGTNEFNAETNRMRQEIDAWVAKYDIQVKEATVNEIAANTAYIIKNTSQLDEKLAIMHQNADSQSKQAIASLQSSLASLRNAAVNEKLSDSEIAVRESQVLVNWANSEGQSIVNKYLDDKQIAEISELASRSDFLDANARNLDRNAKVQWMQTITGYTNAACNIVGTALDAASKFTPAPARFGFK